MSNKVYYVTEATEEIISSDEDSDTSSTIFISSDNESTIVISSDEEKDNDVKF